MILTAGIIKTNSSSVQSLVVLHPVDPISEVAGEEDPRELQHAEPQHAGRHVAEVIHEDVLHDGEAARVEDVLAVGSAGQRCVLERSGGQSPSSEEELYLAAGGGSLDVGLGPVGVVGHSAAGEGLLDIVPGLSHSGVPSLVVVVEPGRHLVLDTLGQVVLQDEGRDGGPELCEEDGDHQSRVDVDHA